MTDKVKQLRRWVSLRSRCLDFFDTHPRTGWFLCLLMGSDVFLHVLELLVR